jgi:1-acyl-sn-glycerol-3-phosphate acyltransferase
MYFLLLNFKTVSFMNRIVMFWNRLKEHVDDPDKLPILIFPEGTCINNTSVMQFKKGSFEVGSVVYPVAIKVIQDSNESGPLYLLVFFFFYSTIRDSPMHFGIRVDFL